MFKSAENKQLLRAVKANDVALFLDAMDKGADFIKYGQKALMNAAEYGAADVIQEILKLTSNVDINTGGYTALHRAVFHGHKHIVEILLDAGANIDYKYDKRTPLFWAVERNHEDIALYLIKRGADVNVALRGSVNALYVALHRDRSLNLIKALVQAGSNLDIRDSRDGDTIGRQLGKRVDISMNDVQAWVAEAEDENHKTVDPGPSPANDDIPEQWARLADTQIIRFSPWAGGQRLQEIFDFAAERIDRIIEVQNTGARHSLDPVYFNDLASTVEVDSAKAELKKQGGSPDVLEHKKAAPSIDPTKRSS